MKKIDKIKHYLKSYIPSCLYLILLLFVAFFFGFPQAIVLSVILFLLNFLLFVVKYKGPLNVHTPEGYDQPYHPSVVFFEKPWNGWSYWMAFSPFPVSGIPYRDRWENPCIVVSNDGIIWSYPQNICALDDLTEEQIRNKNYYSDPHLIYNEKADTLELYYRLNTGKENADVYIFRINSYDGIHWSEKKLLSANSNLLKIPEPVSQSIIFEDDIYKMWFVSNTGGINLRKIVTAYSTDGINWRDFAKVKLCNSSINPWHIDCKVFDGIYYLVVYSFDQQVSLWKSDDGLCFTFAKLLIKPSCCAGVFYNKSLYRSSLVKSDKEWLLFFSASNNVACGIGLMKGNKLEKMRVVSASKINKTNIIQFAREYFTNHTRIISRLSRMKR